MATVDPFPDVNHLALSTTGGVCHGHYLVSGDTLSAVNTERSGEATPPDEGGGGKETISETLTRVSKRLDDLAAGRVKPRKAVYHRDGDHAWIDLKEDPIGPASPDATEPGTRRWCPLCGQGIGGT